ncbi:MAG: ROK family protein [Deltaproteobacteria bacterium]|nr:ROK family protein [Deltaproteobacteria bacterium]
MVESPCVIGVDLGGTNVRLGLVHAGRIMARAEQAVRVERSPAAMVDFLARVITPWRSTTPAPQAIGIGAPGIVDPQRGVILKSPHYPEWVGFDMQAQLDAATGLPVILENDANAIALGEATDGAGQGFANFIMLTLGTGIGGGLILNRDLFRGDVGFAAEVGHMVLDYAGPACPCGGHGCWELYASASAFPQLIDQSDHPLRRQFLDHFHGESGRVTPADVYRLATDGDLFANALWKTFGRFLGTGIASLTNVFGVDHFVIGGGMATAWDFFVPEAHRALARHTYPETAARIQLHRARLGDDAGILGAAALVARRLQ